MRGSKNGYTNALFNVLMLISRTAATFQVPILTKYVENTADRNSTSA